MLATPGAPQRRLLLQLRCWFKHGSVGSSIWTQISEGNSGYASSFEFIADTVDYHSAAQIARNSTNRAQFSYAGSLR